MNRTLLGVLTPSSNTVLEPLTSAMLAALPDVTAHFGRFAVTEISSSPAANAQFEPGNQLAAARLLADARVGSIVWSGTSASWLVFDRDEAMCRRITEETGIPAGSAVRGVNGLFERLGVRRFALVTPYVDDIQQRIIDNYARAGYECVAERHLGEHRNFEFANFPDEQVAGMIEAVAAARPDAISIMCTNMRGARVAPALEARFDLPIIDSTAAALWDGMRLAGARMSRVEGWGRLFAVG